MNVIYWKPLAIAILVGIAGCLGFKFGSDAATATYEKQSTESARQYSEAVTKAQNDARTAEKKSSQLLAQADQRYQNSLKDTKNALDAALASTHNRGLFVRADCSKIGTSGMPEALPSPSRGDGPALVRLPSEIAEGLVRFAGECDAVADQLRAAQDVILADRK